MIQSENFFRRNARRNKFVAHEIGNRNPRFDRTKLPRQMKPCEKTRQERRFKTRALPGAVTNFLHKIFRPLRGIEIPPDPQITAYRKRTKVVNVLNDWNTLPQGFAKNAAGN